MVKVIVFMDGGVIHNVIADVEGIELKIVDYDCEDYADEDLIKVDGEKAHLSTSTVEVSPDTVNEITILQEGKSV